MKYLVFLCCLTMSVKAANKVIYGEDNRLDVYETNNDDYLNWADSTAAMISKNSLELNERGSIKIKGTTLVDSGFCSSERFAHQKAAARCSGFLIAPNILLTAGHCVRGHFDCKNYAWVFNYYQLRLEEDVYVEVGNVYSCKRILDRELSYISKNDYAVLELEKEVDRSPLKFRENGQVELDTPLVVIGHPTGLPTKIADGAWVRKNDSEHFFVANLDTYGGNSGSAVINTNTGEVEGILVRGETDYIRSPNGTCRVSKVCENSECRGEDVTRISSVKYLQNKSL